MTMREWLVAFGCSLAALVGMAIFMIALDTRESSGVSRWASPFFLWRARETTERPLPAALPPRLEPVQR